MQERAMTESSLFERIDGLPHALAAHAIWGIMPLYLVFVHSVPPFEFVAWRIIVTLPLCLAILAWRGTAQEVRQALRDKRTVLAMLGSSLMIGINWLSYVIAIQTGHVYAASLGYYILPIVMMLLGLVVLHERLRAPQWFAVVLASIGVAILAAGALSTLWLGLTIAVTFGFYGLIRKMANLGPLAGLTIETLVLYVPALGIAAWFAMQDGGSSMAKSLDLSAWIILGGPMTAVPLMLFSTAARRMNYSTIGFLQFFSPTIVFLLGLFWFKEEMHPAQMGCFLLIWTAMILFIRNMLKDAKRAALSEKRA